MFVLRLVGMCPNSCVCARVCPRAGIEGRDAGLLNCGKLGVDDRQKATLNITVLGNYQ